MGAIDATLKRLGGMLLSGGLGAVGWAIAEHGMKKAQEADLGGKLSGLAGSFNPFNLSDPFGSGEDRMRAEKERALAAEKEAARKQAAELKASGKKDKANAVLVAKLKERAAYQAKLASERSKWERKAFAAQTAAERARANARIAQIEAAEKLDSLRHEFEAAKARASDSPPLERALDLMQKLQSMTVASGVLPQFNAEALMQKVAPMIDAIRSEDGDEAEAVAALEDDELSGLLSLSEE